jgi:tetratricopeptide (TPR) repeat protein
MTKAALSRALVVSGLVLRLLAAGAARAATLSAQLPSPAPVPAQPASAEPAPGIAASEVAFAEGLTAFQLGRDEEALEKLTAAVRLDREAGSPRYWRGLVLLRLGRFREAAADFEASLAARRPPEVDRTRVLADLAAARRAADRGANGELPLPELQFDRLAIDDRGAWEASAGVAMAADSNPNLLAASLDLPAPEGKPSALVRGAQSDGLADLGLRLAWYPRHDQAGWNPGVSVEAGQSLHHDFGYLNLGQAHAVIQLASGQDPQGFFAGSLGAARLPFGERRFSTLLQVGVSDYWLDGTGYLRSWEGAGAFSFPESAAAATRLDLGFSRRELANQPLVDQRRSGEDLSVGLGQRFFLGRADRSFGIAVKALDRRAERAFADRAGEASLTLALPLALGFSVLLEATGRRDRYRYPDSNLLVLLGPARRDTTWRGAATLAWSAAPRLVLALRGAYTSRTSNVDLGAALPDLGYRRLVVGVGASWALR